MSETQRNFLIVIAIALIALFSTKVNTGLVITEMIIGILFMVMITIALWQLFTRNRTTIASMKPHHRFVLLASAVTAYLLLIAASLVGLGTLRPYVFFGGLALCALGIYWSWTNRWAR